LCKILEKTPGKVFYFDGHGYSDSKRIALTYEGRKEEKEEGILDIYEINNFNYNYRLVALNSCESGDQPGIGSTFWDAFDIPEDCQTGCYLGWHNSPRILWSSLFYTYFWYYNVYRGITIAYATELSPFKWNLLRKYGNQNISLR